MRRTFRTPKGTELPLLSLKGKDYLEVKHRIVWFREEHPDWSIETEIISLTEESAYARATIKDEGGRIVATSHKFESKRGFPDFIEKAETGAIGRALALCGFGTQFCADELDEGKRIVDSPVSHQREENEPAKQEPPWDEEDPGEYVVPRPLKHAGLKIKDIGKPELLASIDYWYKRAERAGKAKPDGKPGEFVEKAEAYIKSLDNSINFEDEPWPDEVAQ